LLTTILAHNVEPGHGRRRDEDPYGEEIPRQSSYAKNSDDGTHEGLKYHRSAWTSARIFFVFHDVILNKEVGKQSQVYAVHYDAVHLRGHGTVAGRS